VKIAIRVLALLVLVLPMPLHAAPEVLPLTTEGLNAVELEAFEPWPDSFVISGVSEHAAKDLHRGEFVASLYEAKPLVLDVSIPFSIDEFVWVTDGELILTHVDGRSESYVAGDTLIVPKGWKGTWEMRGNYREFVVIETRANDTSEGIFKNIGLIIAGWFRDVPHVVPLPAEQLARAELQPVEPTAADLELVDDPDFWKGVTSKRLYEGEFVMELYASPPTTVEISEPFPYDEFVWMLKGELVLTPKGGEAATYGPGEGVVVPQGFIGSWETRGDYRELIIIETKAMKRVHGE
jgi:uncharacterized cupin superfamily protein